MQFRKIKTEKQQTLNKLSRHCVLFSFCWNFCHKQPVYQPEINNVSCASYTSYSLTTKHQQSLPILHRFCLGFFCCPLLPLLCQSRQKQKIRRKNANMVVVMDVAENVGKFSLVIGDGFPGNKHFIVE